MASRIQVAQVARPAEKVAGRVAPAHAWHAPASAVGAHPGALSSLASFADFAVWPHRSPGPSRQPTSPSWHSTPPSPAPPLPQAKLRISQPDDPLEREADRMAEQVLRMPGPALAGVARGGGPIRALSLQRRCAGCEDDDVQRTAQAVQTDVPAAGVDAVATTLRQPGHPLDPGTRAFFEPRFGFDFSRVRIHAGTQAAASARSVDALAYTVGENVVFREGAYAPHTPQGQQLLAHELTHVIQQSRGAAGPHSAGRPDSGSGLPHAGTVHLAEEMAVPRAVREPSSHRALAHAVQAGQGLLSRQVAQDPEPGGAGGCPREASTDLRRHRGVALDPPVRLEEGMLVGYLIYETYQPGESADAFADRAIAAWVPWRFGASSAASQAAVLAFLRQANRGRDVIRGDVTTARPGCNYAIGLEPRLLSRCMVLAGETSPPLPGTPAPRQDEARFRSEVEAGPDAPPGGYALPALPARIDGLEIQPIGSTGTFVMTIEWAAAGADLLSQVSEAYLGASYHWEVWDVTGAPEVQAAEREVRTRLRLSSQADASGVVVTRGAGASRDLDRATADLGARPAQIEADRRRSIAEGRYADELADEINQQLFGLEVVTRYGRELLGGAADLAGDDRDRRIPWQRAGVFVVRCIARVNRALAHGRAPSVATKVVITRSAEAASQQALDLASHQAAERRNLIAIMAAMGDADPAELARLEREAVRLDLQATGTPLAIVEAQLSDARADLARFRQEDAALTEAGLHPPRIAELEARIGALEDQRRLIDRRATALGSGGRGVDRVQASFVSRVTGETYPLLLQLGEPARAGSRHHCVLSDVTTADAHNYEGDADDPIEALRRAIDDLCETSEYGDGSLTLRLPGVPWLSALPQAERVQTKRVRASPRGPAGARARLTEVATALAMLGTAIGSGGIGVAGGLLAAGLAADNLVRRWREGTLRPDAQLVGDLLDVLGAVAIGMRVIGSLGVFNRAGGGFVMRAVRAGATGLRAAGSAADLLGDAGGIIVGNAETLDSLLSISAAERSGNLAPSEARRRRASTIASALQSNTLAIGSHLAGERFVDDLESARTRPESERARPDPDPRPPAATMTGSGPGEPLRPGRTTPAAPGQEAHDRWVADTLAGQMGVRPPPLPRRAGAPLRVNETRYGLRNMHEAMQVYDEFRARAPGREIGLWRNAVTGEYAVTAGSPGSVASPLRRGADGSWAEGHEWGNVLHNHPNEGNVLSYRNPAPQDVFGTWQEAARSGRPVTAFVEHDLPAGGRAFTAVTVTPEGRVQIEYRGADGSRVRPPEIPSLSAYAQEWGSRTVGVDPSSQTYRDFRAALDDLYPDAPPADGARATPGGGPALPRGATMAGTLPASGSGTPPRRRPGRRRGAPDALMDDSGELTASGVAFVRRRFRSLRDLPEPRLRHQFAQGGGPLEAVVRAEITGSYQLTGGQTATNFPIFALDMRGVFERLQQAANQEGGSRQVDGSVLHQSASAFLVAARATDPALGRLFEEVQRLATDRSYRPELDWNGQTRSDCRDFINYRDRSPDGRGRAFLLGEVSTKIPDAIQVALDFNRLVVIDATAAIGNPVHALKTAFYAAVLRAMVPGVTVEAADYRAHHRQQRVSE